MEIGAYLEIDGRSAVQLVRYYPHSIERVWSAVTDPSELAHWFPSEVEIDLRHGGRVTYSGDPHLTDTEGEVLEVDPPRLLVFTWGRDELRFELRGAGAGCEFTLTNVLAEKDTAARNGSGWTVCVAELTKHLSGMSSRGPHSEDALAFGLVYEAHLAAGVPSGAAIPD